MLCSRSASLMSRTRTSFAIATSILRIVAACCASLESNSSRSSLVTPSTIAATSSPNVSEEVGEGQRGVLDRVVQQRAGERDVVEAEVGQDHRDAERVRDVRVARATHLVAVRIAGDDVGPFDEPHVGVGPAGEHAVDQRAQRPVDRGDLGGSTPFAVCVLLIRAAPRGCDARRSGCVRPAPPARAGT